MATASVEGKAVMEIRVFKPNGEKWHHASLDRRKRPWRFLEKVEWSGSAWSNPRRVNHR